MSCSWPFLRLEICVFSLGGSWCFLRLEIFIFLLGFLKVFRNFNVRVWSVSCVIGLGSLVRAFYFLSFLSYRPPRSVLRPRWSLFARLFAFLRPSRRPPHSVLGHGLGNPAAKLRHRTVGFSCSFFFVVLPTPSSAPSRGAARVIWLLTQWHRTVCFVFFSL